MNCSMEILHPWPGGGHNQVIEWIVFFLSDVGVGISLCILFLLFIVYEHDLSNVTGDFATCRSFRYILRFHVGVFDCAIFKENSVVKVF